MSFAGNLEALYAERRSALVVLALSIVGDPEAAADVVQDAFAKALAGRGSLRVEGSLAAWVSTIVVRTAIDRRRASGREVAAGADVEAIDAAAAVGMVDPLLAAAFRRLPERRRLVAFLRFVAGFEYAEIAELVGVAEGTVAATIAQARADLQRTLRQEDPR